MSFILDALKKSESDRQRQSGPALFEVKVTPPRSRLPPWAIAIAALLLVNLAIVGWMLWRHPAAHSETAPPAGESQRAESPAPPAATNVPAPPFSATSTASATAQPPPPAPSMQPAPAALQPAAPLTSPALTSPPAPAMSSGATNPEDYAPAADPGAPGMLGGRVRRDTADGVPLYQDAAATPGTNIPQLRLDLHVFATRAQDRFVMINMHKLREGDSLPEGVHVESITPEGALLSYRGSRFLLPRE